MTDERIQAIEFFSTSQPATRVLVVVPTYNEKENIESMLRTLCALEVAVDVMVVDDASPDGTGDVVAAIAPSLGRRIYLMRHLGKFGLGVAYMDAYRWILRELPDYRVVIQMDADFSHDPRMLPLLIEKAQAYGVSVGSRYVQGGSTPDWNHRRFLLSRAGNLYARWILRLFFPSYLLQDSTAGFVAWRRDVLESVIRYPIFGDGYAYQTSIKLVAFRLGYPAIEVPIIFRDRRLGVSKLNRHIILEAFGMPWKLGWVFRKKMEPMHEPNTKLHDNSLEMWDKYYSSEKGSWFFASVIHWAREVYFGGLFARRVVKLGGPATSYLELGVGTAQTLARLQKMTAAKCVGIEITPRAYELGKAYAPNCELVLGDGMAMPFADKSFDVVYSLGLLEHFEPEEQKQLLLEQARVAKNAVLIEVPARTPHMRTIMWFNRTVRHRRGVWADDELFSPARFRQKYPNLPFRYFFDWASGGITCWFALKPEDIVRYVAKVA